MHTYLKPTAGWRANPLSSYSNDRLQISARKIQIFFFLLKRQRTTRLPAALRSVGKNKDCKLKGRSAKNALLYAQLSFTSNSLAYLCVCLLACDCFGFYAEFLPATFSNDFVAANVFFVWQTIFAFVSSKFIRCSAIKQQQ